MQANNIDEVIEYLTDIINWSRENSSRMGYFAALYRKVTINVKKGIDNGEFDDGERMEKLDVIFANRYLAAFSDFRDGKPVSEVWRIALEAAGWWRPTVLQHLLVGMNAHINLDLGIAAAQVAPGDSYTGLQNDFNKINSVLASLVDEVKEELSQIWPMLRLINAVSARLENDVIDFSMKVARDAAWEFGGKLAPLDSAEQSHLIHKHDSEMTWLADLVVQPPPITSIVLFIVRIGEQHRVRKVIDILC